jgi:hypothetical protein
MESDFLEFTEYIPYCNRNLKTYSPKLTGLLLQIGGYVDSAFKEMADFFKSRAYTRKRGRKVRSEAIGNIVDGFCFFESIYNLSSNYGGHLIAKLDLVGDKEFFPFGQWSSVNFEKLTWWEAYNKVKHQYSLHVKKASFNNILEGLSAALLLNVTHYPSIKLLWQLGYLETGIYSEGGFQKLSLSERAFNDYWDGAVSNLTSLNIGIKMETPLFLYVHR